jgi:hypothetical protein
VVQGFTTKLKEDKAVSAVPNIRHWQVAKTKVGMVDDIRLQERDEL